MTAQHPTTAVTASSILDGSMKRAGLVVADSPAWLGPAVLMAITG